MLREVDDESHNVTASLGLLHLVAADLEQAEPLLRKAATHPKQEIARKLLQFVARVKHGDLTRDDLKRWQFTKVGHNLSFKQEKQKS